MPGRSPGPFSAAAVLYGSGQFREPIVRAKAVATQCGVHGVTHYLGKGEPSLTLVRLRLEKAQSSGSSGYPLLLAFIFVFVARAVISMGSEPGMTESVSGSFLVLLWTFSHTSYSTATESRQGVACGRARARCRAYRTQSNCCRSVPTTLPLPPICVNDSTPAATSIILRSGGSLPTCHSAGAAPSQCYRCSVTSHSIRILLLNDPSQRAGIFEHVTVSTQHTSTCMFTEMQLMPRYSRQNSIITLVQITSTYD